LNEITGLSPLGIHPLGYLDAGIAQKTHHAITSRFCRRDNAAAGWSMTMMLDAYRKSNQ
jgi:hypothetical protein